MSRVLIHAWRCVGTLLGWCVALCRISRLLPIILAVLISASVHSILAERYLSHNQETGSLYSEGYSNVAVMFASIPGFCELYQESEVLEKGVNCLKALNEIIASFDKVNKKQGFPRLQIPSLICICQYFLFRYILLQ